MDVRNRPRRGTGVGSVPSSRLPRMSKLVAGRGSGCWEGAREEGDKRTGGWTREQGVGER